MDEASHSQDRIAAATERLLATAATLTDARAREPSLLPGWTRGHVLTHIARNADGLRNLLIWARTGTEIPMYVSAQARNDDIEAGAGRPEAGLFADVRDSAAAFAAEAATLAGDDWTAQVRALRGPPFPALGVLERRLSEVEIHHVDLAAGYSPADWPAEFVADALPRVAGSFAGRQDAPHCQVWAEGLPHAFRLGPENEDAPWVFVHGQPAELLAWLTGRADGTRLTLGGVAGSGLAEHAGDTVPELPPWR